MYLVERERFAVPRIHDAMRSSYDELARDQGARASSRMAVTGHIDLTDCRPRRAQFDNRSPVIAADYAWLEVPGIHVADA
jgi:hypothetical protein